MKTWLRHLADAAWHLEWGEGPLVVSWMPACERSATERAREGVAEHDREQHQVARHAGEERRAARSMAVGEGRGEPSIA